jgi:hypothetical protein
MPAMFGDSLDKTRSDMKGDMDNFRWCNL